MDQAPVFSNGCSAASMREPLELLEARRKLSCLGLWNTAAAVAAVHPTTSGGVDVNHAVELGGQACAKVVALALGRGAVHDANGALQQRPCMKCSDRKSGHVNRGRGLCDSSSTSCRSCPRNTAKAAARAHPAAPHAARRPRGAGPVQTAAPGRPGGRGAPRCRAGRGARASPA